MLEVGGGAAPVGVEQQRARVGAEGVVERDGRIVVDNKVGVGIEVRRLAAEARGERATAQQQRVVQRSVKADAARVLLLLKLGLRRVCVGGASSALATWRLLDCYTGSACDVCSRPRSARVLLPLVPIPARAPTFCYTRRQPATRLRLRRVQSLDEPSKLAVAAVVERVAVDVAALGARCHAAASAPLAPTGAVATWVVGELTRAEAGEWKHARAHLDPEACGAWRQVGGEVRQPVGPQRGHVGLEDEEVVERAHPHHMQHELVEHQVGRTRVGVIARGEARRCKREAAEARQRAA
eukprot:5183183-Prymnesium_polylepis.1